MGTWGHGVGYWPVQFDSHGDMGTWGHWADHWRIRVATGIVKNRRRATVTRGLLRGQPVSVKHELRARVTRAVLGAGQDGQRAWAVSGPLVPAGHEQHARVRAEAVGAHGA